MNSSNKTNYEGVLERMEDSGVFITPSKLQKLLGECESEILPVGYLDQEGCLLVGLKLKNLKSDEYWIGELFKGVESWEQDRL